MFSRFHTVQRSKVIQVYGIFPYNFWNKILLWACRFLKSMLMSVLHWLTTWQIVCWWWRCILTAGDTFSTQKSYRTADFLTLQSIVTSLLNLLCTLSGVYIYCAKVICIMFVAVNFVFCVLLFLQLLQFVFSDWQIVSTLTLKILALQTQFLVWKIQTW